MDEKDIAIKITGLKKQYRLGVIGGGTLKGDIESWWAKRRGKDDPNQKLGAKTYDKNETFFALDGIDLTVNKGERLGIIGHNGAGKSTLLKILSRVTAPTEGRICIDGRISSMLEVGTGFNPELTGRENIYLNGAILGMTRAEVASKIDQIIAFSECGQFIDTPVKRYSSGMYVKLAFAVAAHLDSEILVMDEVLAVGDMKFQQKCLGKMSDVSSSEGRTVLYVSHNMNTIRQLCSRCIVLDHGKLVFDGEVEDAIAIYSEIKKGEKKSKIDLRDAKRYRGVQLMRQVSFLEAEFLGKKETVFNIDETAHLKLTLDSQIDIENAKIRLGIYDMYNTKIASAICDDVGAVHKGVNEVTLDISFAGLAEDTYRGELIVFDNNDYGTIKEYDIILEAFFFEVHHPSMKYTWNTRKWGSVRLTDMKRAD